MPYFLHTKNYKDFEIRETSTNATIKQFSGARNAGKALPGDIVNPTTEGCELSNRINHHVIAGLLELNSKVRYGFSSRNTPIYLFTPFNEAYPPFVVGCSEKQPSPNRYALIRFENEWTETFPKGHLQRLLPIDAEEEALFWTYSPRACEKYRGTFPDVPNLDNRQLLKGTTFHIDPPGCKDVDDVLTIEQDETDTFITITIADVATSVPENHPLDLRASTIGQTFYQDSVQPKHMFPPELSENTLSLLPCPVAKPGLSLRFNLADPINTTTWFESAVLTNTSYTYDSIYANKTLSSILEQMCLTLEAQSSDSHKWIEVAMKFYNIEAAKLLKQHGTGLLRSHTLPDEEKLKNYVSIDPNLGFLAYNSAKYIDATSEHTHHWGLDTHAYTHITSPIRRYADLVNQRALKTILTSSSPYIKVKNELVICLNKIAKANKQHDRDYLFIQALKNPKPHIEAKIIDIRSVPDNCSKLSIYVADWKQLIKLTYKNGPEENTVLTKDEKTLIPIHIGKLLLLTYHVDLKARSWKKRMVLSIL